MQKTDSENFRVAPNPIAIRILNVHVALRVIFNIIWTIHFLGKSNLNRVKNRQKK